MYYYSIWVYEYMLLLHPRFFSSITGLLQVNLREAASLEKVYPIIASPAGTTRALNFFRQLKCLGYTPNQNSFLHELGGL